MAKNAGSIVSSKIRFKSRDGRQRCLSSIEALNRNLDQCHFSVAYSYCTSAVCPVRRSNSQMPGASHDDPLKRKDIFDHLIIPGTVKSVSEDIFRLGIWEHGKRSEFAH